MQKLSKKCQQIKSDSVNNIIYHGQKEVYSRYKRLVQHLKINQCNSSHQQKGKNNIIILINAKSPFDKMQYPFIIKTLSKLGIKNNLIKLIKNTKNPTASILFNNEKLKAFLLTSGKKKQKTFHKCL